MKLIKIFLFLWNILKTIILKMFLALTVIKV